MQLFAAVLYFYVFILAAVLLTGWGFWLCWRFFRDTRKKNGGK